MSPKREEERKYDRQLRIWGSHGQRCLSEAYICVLGSSPCATETLKNLVLPGVGRFLVVDDAVVCNKDLGHNFFVCETDVGRPRAEAVVESLSDLNPDCVGAFVIRSPEDAASDRDFLLQFSLIIAANLSLKGASSISEICQSSLSSSSTSTTSTPPSPQSPHSSPGPPTSLPSVVDSSRRPCLIWIRSVGFIGSVRLYAESHSVFENHDEKQYDLRIAKPFPELLKFAEEIKLNTLGDAQHSHVPFVILLIQLFEQYRQQHNSFPSDTDGRKEVGQLLEKLRRSSSELNFDEAARYMPRIFRSYDTHLSPETREFFNVARTRSSAAARLLQSPGKTAKRRKQECAAGDEALSPLEAQTKRNDGDGQSEDREGRRTQLFWLVGDCIGCFYEKTGDLPHDGALPDLTSDTETFMKLQKIYKSKADRDLSDVRSLVQDKLNDALGIITGQQVVSQNDACTDTANAGLGGGCLTKEEEDFIRYLCRHSSQLNVLFYPSIAEENDGQGKSLIKLCEEEGSDNESEVGWYLMLWACEIFRERYGHWPGCLDGAASNDEALRKESTKLLALYADLVRPIGVRSLFVDTAGATDDDENVKKAIAMVSGSGVELHAISALIGGVAAQEAVKLVTHQFSPLFHTFVFNGISSTGQVFKT